jgi:transcriptional regulator
MYIPDAFHESDPDRLQAFMAENSFATLISPAEAGPIATHLPLLLDGKAGPQGMLVGHMARANPHWREFESGRLVLVIFHGPHEYISPDWQSSELALPTWNYAAVHVYARPALIEETARVRQTLDDLVQASEAGRSSPWPNALPEEFRSKMERAIVAFELSIERIEGKFKLSQNRPAADQKSALKGLESERPGSQLADFWRPLLKGLADTR